MFEDKTLKCEDCGQDFIFTAGEQEFYAEKGFQNEPKRCKACRDNRKNATKANREMLQLAQTAAKRQRFLSSPTTTDPYTAASASRQ